MPSSSVSHLEPHTWARRPYGPREVTENAPSYLFGEYINRRLRRADDELAALHADADDVQVAQERLQEIEVEGTVSWRSIKKDLEL